MIKNECAFYGEPPAGAGASGLEESYQGLITAVIRQAVKDYVSVLLRLFSCPAGKKKAALEMEKANWRSSSFRLVPYPDGYEWGTAASFGKAAGHGES